ncbi:MAG: hypothetical protein ACLQM6_14685 [Acidobacteriaceae bacterium]
MKIFVVAIVAALTFSMIGCSNPNGFGYQNVSISLTEFCNYSCSSIAYDPNNPGVWEIAQTEYFVTATAYNAAPNFTWALYPTENLSEPAPYPTGGGIPVGESSAGPTDGWLDANPGEIGNTVIYYPPGGAPVYSGAALTQAQNFQYTITYTQQTLSVQGVPSITTISTPATGIPQGEILLAVSVPSNPSNPAQTYTYYQLMEIMGGRSVYLSPSNPTSPAGLTNSVVTVPHGTSFQFYGGEVGNGNCTTASSCALNATGYQTINSIDNTVVWEAGNTSTTAVVGGNATYGTISTSGLYTAPAAIPAGTTAPQACVVIAADTLLTTTKYAYITIN